MATNTNSSVYYKTKYWNDLPQVVNYINQKTTGDMNIFWMFFLKNYFEKKSKQRFKRALMLNCGNGWVERDLNKLDFVDEFVGVDCCESLLQEASDNAEKENLNASYYLMDTNDAQFPHEEYDLVINYAACHHLSHLDKVMYALFNTMPSDGLFVSFDYVGPHRNQYPESLWSVLHQLNDYLHPNIQQSLSYPHLPTMMLNDPTEAIHSELFLRTHDRYFEKLYHKQIGGCLAYPLITFNNNLFACDDADLVSQQVEFLLQKDQEYTEVTNDSFFDFIISKPKANLNKKTIKDALSAEITREAEAANNHGLYYPLTTFQKEYIMSCAGCWEGFNKFSIGDNFKMAEIRARSKDYVASKVFFENALWLVSAAQDEEV